VGLEWGPLSLVSTIEELLERKKQGPRSRKPRLRPYEIRRVDYAAPFYPQKSVLTSQTSHGRSVDIVRSRTKATELFIYLLLMSFHSLRIVIYTHLRRTQWPRSLRYSYTGIVGSN
jgi:hypothetical protein